MAAMNTDNIRWSGNVIVADADYLGRVALNLSVGFERMLDRRVPPADFATWAVDVSLDGGLRPGSHETQVVLVHEAARQRLECFVPSAFDTELNGQAFRDARMGEYIVSSYPVEAMTSKDQFIADIVETLCQQPAVSRIMVVPDTEQGDALDRMRPALERLASGKEVTVFAMQPLPGGSFRQEILGYSVMNALGIRADELKG